MNHDHHTALVYMAEARAEKNKAHPEWKATLVKWARARWHSYVNGKRFVQGDLFNDLPTN